MPSVELEMALATLLAPEGGYAMAVVGWDIVDGDALLLTLVVLTTLPLLLVLALVLVLDVIMEMWRSLPLSTCQLRRSVCAKCFDD